MQFFVYFTRDPDEPMTPPTPEGMAEMGQIMQETIASGLVVATGALAQDVTLVTLKDGDVSIGDGPFMEGKELIPGFTVVQADSKQEAIDFATRLRRCMGDGVIRVVPLMAGTTAE